MKHLKLSATIWKEKNSYVSKCPELNVASCGKTVEEATGNLKEAVELYLENVAAIGFTEIIERLKKCEDIFNTYFEVSYGKVAGGF